MIRLHIHGLNLKVKLLLYFMCCYGAGSLTVKDGSVVVVECASGETYTIEMFDHVRIQVTSKVSHTHGYSLSLRLLKCGPVAPQLNNVSKQAQVGGNKELMKVSSKPAVAKIIT